MKILLGIGNPGMKYTNTPHNIGFYFIDALSNSNSFKNEHKALTEKITLGSEAIVLTKPTTYVNLSGEAAGALIRYYKLKTKDLIVITDDVNLEAGAIRIRIKGSHGGHNGLRNIIQQCGDDFVRIRIGVGLCPPKWELSSYVLRKLKPQETKIFEEMQNTISDLIIFGIENGWEAAAAKFNRKSFEV